MKIMQLKTKPKGPIIIPLLSIRGVTYLSMPALQLFGLLLSNGPGSGF